MGQFAKPTTHLRHMGLVVRSLNKQVKFYSEMLGFKIVVQANEDKSFISEILRLNKYNLRTVKMTIDKPSDSLLELLYFEGAANQSNEIYPDTPGYTHIALTVTDIDEMFKKMESQGTQFFSEPKLSPDGNAKVVFCRDPEGNLLELVEMQKK